MLTVLEETEYNQSAKELWREWMKTFFDIALIITSIATVICAVLQNRGAGMGSRTGSEPGAVFSACRGVEKILFYVTIGFSALLVVLVVTSVLIF